MKMKVTNKLLKNNYFKMYVVGYCDLQHIMNGIEPRFYNAGVYGWNFDVYESPDGRAVISTGYRNMQGVRIPSDIIKKYDKKVSAINAKYNLWVDYEKRKKALDKLRVKFWDEIETI